MTRDIFLSNDLVDLVLLKERDAPQLQRWMNDHQINQFLGRGALPMYLEQEKAWVNGLPERNNHLVLGIWHRADEQLIGSIGLHEIDMLHQTAELGIVIGKKDYWSQGLGTSAIGTLCHHGFTRLNLRHITLRVLGNNPRGATCYTRLGFGQTGMIPGHVFKEGAWHDEVHMLLTRNTFASG